MTDVESPGKIERVDKYGQKCNIGEENFVSGTRCKELDSYTPFSKKMSQ